MQPEGHRLHFIAIGGSVMHNLAIALKSSGYQVSGSDDEFYEPSRSALFRHGLLPDNPGWYPEKVTQSLDGVILGMHAKADNPELLRAQELGIPVYSFPEFIFNYSRDKQRIVVAGSHGKTTITSMVMHVLKHFDRKFDYVVGASLKGFDASVRLTKDAPIIIIEGDEYLSSALDPVPKFIRYQHHIGLISGIAWDHANVFQTEEDYVKQFDVFADQTPKGGILIFSEQDSLAMMIGKKERVDVLAVTYRSHPHVEKGGQTYLTNGKEHHKIKVFGSHNLSNISAAKEIVKRVGITNEQFFEAIASFEGASGRLENIFSENTFSIYKDFAHAPSKVKATIKALKEHQPNRGVIACLELHTYSSLSKSYLPQYRDSMKAAQSAIVYYNPEKISSKKLEPISVEDIKTAFNSNSIQVFTKADDMAQHIKSLGKANTNLLMMSSGNFGGIDLSTLA